MSIVKSSEVLEVESLVTMVIEINATAQSSTGDVPNRWKTSRHGTMLFDVSLGCIGLRVFTGQRILGETDSHFGCFLPLFGYNNRSAVDLERMPGIYPSNWATLPVQPI